MRLLAVFNILITTLLAVVPTIVIAGEVPAYRWMREIDLPEISNTTLVRVPLDSHFYEFTREDWPDVRLQNMNGDAIGWKIQTAKAGKDHTIRRFWTAEQLSARVTEAVGLQIEFELRPKDPLPSGVRIVTPLRDFEHQVQVESSVDGRSWVAAGSPAMIFDYSRHVDARSDLVPMNAGDHRRFRITIADLTAEQGFLLLDLQRRLRGSEEIDRTERTLIARRPFRIDRLEFYRDDGQPEQRDVQSTVYPANNFSMSEKTKEQQTILEFDCQREPVTGLRIITNEENFSRAATIEVKESGVNEKPGWRTVATGTLTRFDVGTIHREELKISFKEHRSKSYRVVIENRDSTPLAITGVELIGPIYELAFLASPGQKAILKYGSPDAKAGSYDTAALQAVLAQQVQVLTTATLLAPSENSNAPKAPSWSPWNDTRVLVGGIIALTLLLAWGLFRASRRLQTMPPADGG